MNHNELKDRQKVWLAFSLLYLDTSLDYNDYDALCKSLTDSKFTITELKDIDLYEVFPTLHTNLRSMAGVWDGFDKQWLFNECLKHYHRRKKPLFQIKIKLLNNFHGKYRSSHWQEIESRFSIKEQ